VLDGYGVERAHLVGLSMGGYIAQILAARHAQRVDKLVLLSTTADHRPYMAATTGDATAMQDAFLSPPSASFIASIAEAASRTPGSREEAEQIALAVWRSIYAFDVNAEGSGHAFPADFILDCLRKARSRGHDQAAAFQHAAAVLTSPPRLALLDAIRAPTLVIHGRSDPCLPLDHGKYLASHIHGAQLRVLAMGHMFPPEMSGEIAGLVAAFIG
jgi:pimeloyl-ACP methyl ester carboxylesterase